MIIQINHKEIFVKDSFSEKCLLEFLREDLDLTGTKNGCGIGVCGACTILLNNNPVRACRKKVKDAINGEILTIEGMQQEDGSLHPLQQAFIDAGAIQCGFCTPGMLMAAEALLRTHPNPDDNEIRDGISGNLCRCTGYNMIVEAIKLAAQRGEGIW